MPVLVALLQVRFLPLAVLACGWLSGKIDGLSVLTWNILGTNLSVGAHSAVMRTICRCVFSFFFIFY